MWKISISSNNLEEIKDFAESFLKQDPYSTFNLFEVRKRERERKREGWRENEREKGEERREKERKKKKKS